MQVPSVIIPLFRVSVDEGDHLVDSLVGLAQKENKLWRWWCLRAGAAVCCQTIRHRNANILKSKLNAGVRPQDSPLALALLAFAFCVKLSFSFSAARSANKACNHKPVRNQAYREATF